MSEHALSVRRLRFRGRSAHPLRVQRRVEAALADGASETGLGPDSILCVRRLALTLPRSPRLGSALGAEASAAARPAGGPVPANANAVLFADRAELLACLARDWSAGIPGAGWWWTVLFPRDDLGAVVRRIWLEDARPVPAALARLESAGLAPRFLAKLSPADLAILWRNIVNTFHLPALDTAAIDPDPADSGAMGQEGEAPPWTPWIVPASSLTANAARVLVTAILLERAPAIVRSTPFARAVGAWNRSNQTRSILAVDSNEDFPSFEDASAKIEAPRGVPAPVTFPSSRNNEENPRTDPIVLHGPSEAERDAPARPLGTEEVDQAPFTPSPPASERPADPRKGEMRSVPCGNGPSIDSDAAALQESVALPLGACPERIATEWGGTIYLVNVAIALEYYGDFSNPASPGLALPLWDFLALAGGRMAGEKFAEDPLPALFAKLSGRAEGEPPGAQFDPPNGESLTSWLDRICQELRARVLASLGLGDECDLRALVLNHPANIVASSARVDVHFSLANHPIALRIAGLDRDPGWVPASGRSIYFHYD